MGKIFQYAIISADNNFTFTKPESVLIMCLPNRYFISTFISVSPPRISVFVSKMVSKMPKSYFLWCSALLGTCLTTKITNCKERKIFQQIDNSIIRRCHNLQCNICLRQTQHDLYIPFTSDTDRKMVNEILITGSLHKVLTL